MELPWPYARCITCLRDDVPMSRSHLVPAAIGGFAWARTHCGPCNSKLGSQVEFQVKRDPSIRHALEVELAEVIPDVAKRYAERQRYVADSDLGKLEASYRNGAVELGTTRVGESIVQSDERARSSLAKMLDCTGVTPAERGAALELAAAATGDWTRISDDIAVRRGVAESAGLPYDGTPVSDRFVVSLAYHLLALLAGAAVYEEAFAPIRAFILDEADTPAVGVQPARSPSGQYLPRFELVVDQGSPHVIVRVQLFGWLLWGVHFTGVRADHLDGCGLAIDVQANEVVGIVPPRLAA